MSPSALDGLHHSRAASVNGGGPIGATSNTKAGGMDAPKGSGRVYAHLDDLVSARPNIDLNTPIRTVLQEGELLAKQADTHLDFRRPDIALQEYIKASIVAIEIIPRHKDYVSLQSGGSAELHRLFIGLNKRINSQHAKFAEVKLLIKENNAKSGVLPAKKPVVAVTKTNGTNGHVRAQSVQSPPLNSTTNGIPVRTKPPILPKPNSLHGNALPQPNQSVGQSDLASRLAGLRARPGAEVQDPRIKTQSIPGVQSPASSLSTTSLTNSSTQSRPFGPREMPSVPTTIPGSLKPPLDVSIPTLPRAPDAIYSPSQNADTPGAANLLSSVPRSGSYLGNLRQGAAPPISNHVPTPGLLDNRNDYFTPSHAQGSPSYLPKKKPIPQIPDSGTVSAEDLMSYLNYGSHTLKVLLVDVRSREEFENGHILTQSIICVEPITLRTGVSAEQLGDSMIIAPDAEQALYEQRHDFDLIVFYDQDSTSLKPESATGSDGALLHFSKAVYDYDYERRLKRRPMLLVGGLDAWTDLLGPNSLKSSISRTGSPAPDAAKQKLGRPLGRVPPARQPPAVPLRRKKTYSSRPLSKEEESKWDQTLKEDSALWTANEAERAKSAELVYAKTTEDFFRKYPELPAIQESMVSPLPQSKPQVIDSFAPALPQPPARPAPALPRQRSSGLNERGPTTISSPAHTAGAITQYRVPPGLTGLDNPGVTCYMNSAIQAISATPFLRQLFLHFSETKEKHRVPRKAAEFSDPPQLLVRSFALLMGHLWSGTSDYLKPTSFSKYINSVHAGAVNNEQVRSRAYGGIARQHDSAEFLNFVMEILDDELNPTRDYPPPKHDDQKYEDALNQGDFSDAAELAWKHWMTRENSPISKKMKGLVGHVSKCALCGRESRTFETIAYLNLTMPADGEEYSVKELIRRDHGTLSTIDDYICCHCKQKSSASRWDYLCYLPDYFVIQLNRYSGDGARKLKNYVTFPERSFDIPSSSVKSHNVPGTDHRRRGPFLYDVYGVTMHRGESITSGHYYTLARSLDKSANGAAGKWHSFNDRMVREVPFKETQGRLPAMLFLKRQGSADI